jgi:hypothetical protein
LILLDSICRDFRVGDQTVHALKDICLEKVRIPMEDFVGSRPYLDALEESEPE